MRKAKWGSASASREARREAARVAVLALGLAVGACTGYRNYRKAQLAEEQGDWDQAVLQYLSLLDRDPGNLTYRSGLLRAKFKASQYHFERAKEFHQAGALERAALEYQQAVQLDPTNQYAQVELDKVREEIASARDGESLLTLDDLKRRTQESRPQPPMLSPREKDPISLNFPKPVSVKDIYDAIGKAFGINITYDSKLRDQKLTESFGESAEPLCWPDPEADPDDEIVQREHAVVVDVMRGLLAGTAVGIGAGAGCERPSRFCAG